MVVWPTKRVNRGDSGLSCLDKIAGIERSCDIFFVATVIWTADLLEFLENRESVSDCHPDHKSC